VYLSNAALAVSDALQTPLTHVDLLLAADDPLGVTIDHEAGHALVRRQRGIGDREYELWSAVCTLP